MTKKLCSACLMLLMVFSILPEREWGRHRLYSTDHTGRTDKGGFYRDGTGA